MCAQSDPSFHPAAQTHAEDFRAGRMSRRDFMSYTTSLGLSATAAAALGGFAAPARAAGHAQQGGTLKIESTVIAMKDPRTFDWPQLSNFSRGWLEYLVEYNSDGSFRGILLDGWDVNDDATEYTLNIRPGVTWNDGTAFTAADVAHNIERWADSTVEGNSMASRMGGLVDSATGKLRDGAMEIIDDTTVRLTLPSPDITLIAGFSDYPAAVVPQDFDGDPLASPKGTGPYLPESYEVGVRAVLVRNEDHDWWGKGVIGEAALDRIEYIDFGTDQASILAAADAGEVDMVYESLGEFIDIFDGIGWVKSEAVTANTLVIRPNQTVAPYDDVRVRRALAMAVDNSVLLSLGYSGLGVPAENHHVCPIHPEYAELPGMAPDPDGARALMQEAGQADFEHELISIDDTWRRNTSDAAAAQLRDAGINVKRTILPGATFWNDWTKYPYSTTDWAQRPLGVQVLGLAYRSGEPWNESGFANAEFDAELSRALAISNADARRESMAKLQKIMQDEGVILQPYWRSTFRHTRDGVIGGEQHPTFEIHLYKLALAA